MPKSGESNGHGAHAPFGLRRDARGRLVLTDAGGREHVGVVPVRAFPLSDPGHGIALCDSEGREVAWVEDMGELAPSVRRLVEEELAGRDFQPIIQRILHISPPPDPTEWEVETDRGRTRFLVPSEDDIHRLDDRRALITDTHGACYLIADLHALDVTSRRLLERYL
jgi:hypothetical protein